MKGRHELNAPVPSVPAAGGGCEALASGLARLQPGLPRRPPATCRSRLTSRSQPRRPEAPVSAPAVCTGRGSQWGGGHSAPRAPRGTVPTPPRRAPRAVPSVPGDVATAPARPARAVLCPRRAWERRGPQRPSGPASLRPGGPCRAEPGPLPAPHRSSTRSSRSSPRQKAKDAQGPSVTCKPLPL